jgi:hypothetical protein
MRYNADRFVEGVDDAMRKCDAEKDQPKTESHRHAPNRPEKNLGLKGGSGEPTDPRVRRAADRLRGRPDVRAGRRLLLLFLVAGIALMFVGAIVSWRNISEGRRPWCARVRECLGTGTPTHGRQSDGVASGHETRSARAPASRTPRRARSRSPRRAPPRPHAPRLVRADGS